MEILTTLHHFALELSKKIKNCLGLYRNHVLVGKQTSGQKKKCNLIKPMGSKLAVQQADFFDRHFTCNKLFALKTDQSTASLFKPKDFSTF